MSVVNGISMSRRQPRSQVVRRARRQEKGYQIQVQKRKRGHCRNKEGYWKVRKSINFTSKTAFSDPFVKKESYSNLE